MRNHHPPPPPSNPKGQKKKPPTLIEKSAPLQKSEVSPTDFMVDQIANKILGQVGSMVNARLEALESRLLPEKAIRPALKKQAQTVLPLTLQQQTEDRRKQKGQQSLRKNDGGAATTYAAAAAIVGQAATTGAKSAKTGTTKGKMGPKTAVKDKVGQGQKLQVQVQQQQQKPQSTHTTPTPSASLDTGWELVEGKKGKNKNGKKKTLGKGSAAKSETSSKVKEGPRRTAEASARRKVKIRPPRSAAVILTPTAEALTRAEIMAEARRKVKFEDIGITYIRPKIAMTGAIILEVPGEDSAAKADRLAQKLRVALADKEVRVNRSIKIAELRIGGLDESITRDDLAGAVAGAGDCPHEEIRVGEIRKGNSGLGVAWVRCPAVVARRLADASRLMVG